MNSTTGTLTFVRVTGTPQTLANPSFLALDPHGRYLFCGNEIANYEGRQSGSVTSFSIDSATGELTEINRQPTEGRNPAHVTVDPTGRFVFAANYSGTTTATNHVAVIPIEAGGRLGTPTQIVTHTGTLGPNTGRQEAPHAHQVMVDPAGRWITANDLGLDRTFVYFLDRNEGRLIANDNPIPAPAGGGPRHLAFHPNGRWTYVLRELNSTLGAYVWDTERGAGTLINSLSTLPSWYVGINTTAQVVVSPDGRFVYASNRGHDSIAVFSIDQSTGGITYLGEHWTFGETPRNFNIDPSGTFMYVAHQNTDNIVTFRINRTTGRLEFTEQVITLGQPVCIVFHTPPAAGNSVQPGVTFTALQNPAFPGPTGSATVTLAWNAPGATELEIRVGAPDGSNMGRHGSWGTAETGPWVVDGMTFYLQDVSGGKPLTSANTLGTVRVALRR
jgi:6-phosphogluconolactonase